MSVSFKLAWRALRQNLLTTGLLFLQFPYPAVYSWGHGKPSNPSKLPLLSQLVGLMQCWEREVPSCSLCSTLCFIWKIPRGIWLGSSMRRFNPTPEYPRHILLPWGIIIWVTGWLVPPQAYLRSTVETGKKISGKKAWKNIF